MEGPASFETFDYIGDDPAFVLSGKLTAGYGSMWGPDPTKPGDNYAFHKQNRLGSAIREGEYKLIKNYDDDSLELYDLTSDLSEKNNLAAKSPELAKRLAEKLARWLRESDAQFPVR